MGSGQDDRRADQGAPADHPEVGCAEEVGVPGLAKHHLPWPRTRTSLHAVHYSYSSCNFAQKKRQSKGSDFDRQAFFSDSVHHFEKLSSSFFTKTQFKNGKTQFFRNFDSVNIVTSVPKNLLSRFL